MKKVILYMAVISGWTEVKAFSTDLEKAKKMALKAKKERCKDDLSKWTWKTCEEYYGAFVVEITEGTIIT